MPPSAGLPSASNHRFTRARLPRPAACGKSSGIGQTRVSNGMTSDLASINGYSMLCESRRMPKDCRIPIEQRAEDRRVAAPRDLVLVVVSGRRQWPCG
jgi:hypothetical protein